MTDDKIFLPTPRAATPAADPTPVVAKKTAEEWGAEKKHTRAQNRAGQKSAVMPDWRFAAAKAHEGWPVGKELSEAEYDDAVARATGAPLR
jgi:hypothetical protein